MLFYARPLFHRTARSPDKTTAAGVLCPGGYVEGTAAVICRHCVENYHRAFETDDASNGEVGCGDNGNRRLGILAPWDFRESSRVDIPERYPLMSADVAASAATVAGVVKIFAFLGECKQLGYSRIKITALEAAPGNFRPNGECRERPSNSHRKVLLRRGRVQCDWKPRGYGLLPLQLMSRVGSRSGKRIHALAQR